MAIPNFDSWFTSIRQIWLVLPKCGHLYMIFTYYILKCSCASIPTWFLRFFWKNKKIKRKEENFQDFHFWGSCKNDEKVRWDSFVLDTYFFFFFHFGKCIFQQSWRCKNHNKIPASPFLSYTNCLFLNANCNRQDVCWCD